MSLEERVAEIVIEQLEVVKEKIIPEASIENDLGADSLDVIELIMAMEEEFGLKIDDKEAEKLKTIKDICDYVSSHE